MATYSLGSNDAELARLEAQAEFIREPTRLLLGASGIEAGMRVLDLGTGLGHVAVAVADLVGPGGRVVGLERDPRMLELARIRSGHLPHVELVQGDVTQWRDVEPFDAVVGRLIMFHLPDPVATLRHHLRALRPGGRVVLLDYDLAGMRTEPREPFTEQLTTLVMAAFRAAGADPTIGAKLQRILGAAGVSDVGGLAISQYLPPDSPVGPAMLGGVVRSLAPVMVRHGLATEDELDLDTLGPRIADAVQAAGAVLVPPVLAGAWGRR
jgi:SAM-dependent methyltransferase